MEGLVHRTVRSQQHSQLAALDQVTVALLLNTIVQWQKGDAAFENLVEHCRWSVNVLVNTFGMMEEQATGVC